MFNRKRKQGKYKKFLIIGLLLILSGCANSYSNDSSPIVKKDNDSSFNEYCFTISSNVVFGMDKVRTTPSNFLDSRANVIAAINGVYYSKDTGEPLGIAYVADDQHIGDKRGRVSGYFTISRDGNIVGVREEFNDVSDNYLNYSAVIGTHPILLLNGIVNEQALSDRYKFIYDSNGKKIGENRNYRSAIGTKDGENICFAVDGQFISMGEWANELRRNGYRDALNLDGGGPSQMAIRGQGVFGGGTEVTKHIIYAMER